MTTQVFVEAITQNILDLFLALALALLTRYAIPYLKAKTTAEDLEYIKNLVKAAVDAAEQKFIGPKLGPDVRKPWVKNLLENAGLIVDDLIDAMIDAAVRAMNAAVDATEDAAKEAVQEATEGRVTEETAQAILEALTKLLMPQEGENAPQEEQ